MIGGMHEVGNQVRVGALRSSSSGRVSLTVTTATRYSVAAIDRVI